MGYYDIEASPDVLNSCKLVLPWSKYEYCKLPMGLCNSPDNFQDNTNELFEEIEDVLVYIDGLLLIRKGTYEEHLKKPDKVLKKLEKAGLKVNMNKYTWKSRAEMLDPLTKLCFKNQPWKYTDIEQKAFKDIKKTVAKKALLLYPDFNKPFGIHTDASQYQLGATISQGGIPIAFFPRNLNSAQLNYSTTEKSCWV
eukprot:8204508-Ditylum_brightwellii.AAC.1